MSDRTRTEEEIIEADSASGKKSRRPDQSYWSLVKHQYRKNKPAVVALWFIYFLAGVALFADFIANDKPIYCTYKGTTYFPIIKE